MGARIPVRVRASARTNEVVGFRDGVLRVRVSAPAIDGRANDALRRLIAKRLHVSKSSVAVTRGQRTRDKLIQVDGLDQAAVLDRLTD